MIWLLMLLSVPVRGTKRGKYRVTPSIWVSSRSPAILRAHVAALVLCSILLTGCAPNSNPKTATRSAEHDFGEVMPGGTVTVDIPIHNPTSEEWHIKKDGIRTSCNCVITTISRHSIPPGGTASIGLQVEASRRPGPFRQNVTVDLVQSISGSLEQFDIILRGSVIEVFSVNVNGLIFIEGEQAQQRFTVEVSERIQLESLDLTSSLPDSVELKISRAERTYTVDAVVSDWEGLRNVSTPPFVWVVAKVKSGVGTRIPTGGKGEHIIPIVARTKSMPKATPGVVRCEHFGENMQKAVFLMTPLNPDLVSRVALLAGDREINCSFSRFSDSAIKVEVRADENQIVFQDGFHKASVQIVLSDATVVLAEVSLLSGDQE